MNSVKISLDDVPREQDTEPEVFIVECLGLEEWKKGKRDGFELYLQLLQSGRRPRYVQALCENDLKMAMIMFRQSKCRFLHFSFHGGINLIRLGGGMCDYGAFAGAVCGAINSRRVFISACECGNAAMFNCLYETNPVMHSVLAHSNQLTFERALSFWSSFYNALYLRMEKFSKRRGGLAGLTTRNIKDIAGRLATVLELELSIGYYDSKHKTKVMELLKVSKGKFSWVPMKQVDH